MISNHYIRRLTQLFNRILLFESRYIYFPYDLFDDDTFDHLHYI